MAQEIVKHRTKKIGAYIKDDEHGKILLPNFQRKFVWTPNQQKKLLSSLLAGVPIGSTLLLEADKTDMAVRQLCFNELLIEPNSDAGREYLLDGQQRFSSIKNALSDITAAGIQDGISEKLRKKLEVENWRDLKALLPEDLQMRWFLEITDEDFGLEKGKFHPPIGLIPDHYMTKLHYQRSEDEKFWSCDDEQGKELSKFCVSKGWLPLWKLDKGIFIKDLLKKMLSNANSNLTDKTRNKWASDVREHLRRMTLDAEVPNILINQREMNIAIAVFEQVNTSGTQLSILDLLAAKMAKISKTPLLDLLHSKLESEHSYFGEREWSPLSFKNSHQKFWEKETPTKQFEDAYVNCLALTCYLKSNPNDPRAYKFTKNALKKDQLYKLSGKLIAESWEDAYKHLMHAYAFLVERCGVVKFSDIPFKLMIVPIFIVISRLTSRSAHKEIFDRLEFWYWRSIFDEKYSTSQNERMFHDLSKICDLCIDGEGIEKFDFDLENELLMERPDFSDFDSVSLIGKGVNRRLTKPIMQFFLSVKPLDVLNKDVELTAWDMLFGKRIHIDHILPIRKRKSDRKDRFNSALMQTYLLGESNLEKSDNTHDFQNYFHDSVIRKKHLVPDNVSDIGKKFDGCKKKKKAENKVAAEFMAERHSRLKDEIKDRLRLLRKSL